MTTLLLSLLLSIFKNGLVGPLVFLGIVVVFTIFVVKNFKAKEDKPDKRW